MNDKKLDPFLNEILDAIFRPRKWSCGDRRELNHLQKKLGTIFKKYGWELKVEKIWTNEVVDLNIEVKENVIYLKQIKK